MYVRYSTTILHQTLATWALRKKWEVWIRLNFCGIPVLHDLTLRGPDGCIEKQKALSIFMKFFIKLISLWTSFLDAFTRCVFGQKALVYAWENNIPRQRHWINSCGSVHTYGSFTKICSALGYVISTQFSWFSWYAWW